ncbi:Uncharacterised protein [Salmonella enterica subsp. enterica serovar Typhi]|nr:Uncharacterised protein [Salmonella enterica subsp. enterica serovar Typhi]
MKPVFDENGLATVPGDMRCYYYDAVGTHDMKKETAHWGAGINTVSQASEIHATLAQLFYQRNKMPHTAPQSVQLPDNQRVSCR